MDEHHEFLEPMMVKVCGIVQSLFAVQLTCEPAFGAQSNSTVIPALLRRRRHRTVQFKIKLNVVTINQPAEVWQSSNEAERTVKEIANFLSSCRFSYIS